MTAAGFRPLDYVEPESVIRRIGDRDLWLGNKHAADHTRHDRSFDSVLSLTTDPCPMTTHHEPLYDGPKTGWKRYADAVETARTLFGQPDSVLIHCRAGISRSTAISATTLAAEEDRSFRQALEAVQTARPIAMPHPALHELGVVYLTAQT
jgi:atypical dual specificity phosphatase